MLFVGGLWWTRGRDPGGPDSVPVRYDPPDGMTPAEVGTVLDERVDIDDVTATILDLAVRGHLEIHELDRKSFFFLSNSDYELRRIYQDETGLKSHEKKLLAAIFGERSSRVLSDMKDHFYKSLPGIKEALYLDVSKRSGWFPTRPDRVRSHWMVFGVAFGMLAVFLFLVIEQGPLALAAGMSAAIVVAFGRHMPRKTLKGRRAAQHIEGFREFVLRVEVDRLERLGLRTVGQFEKILPYAFVLGASDAWAEAFADLYSAEPSWYHGQPGGTFRPRRFVSRVGRSLERAGQTMQSRPKSSGSGSSGFGGGGFSGGGFGGGGGGSW